MRIIRGVVYKDGKKQAGGGYKVKTSPSSGTYDITFDEPFNTLSAVVATPYWPETTDLRDNCVVTELSLEGCRIATGAGDGRWSLRHFQLHRHGRRHTGF
ncbi:hypothetical protein ABZ615_11695 [Streptomyces sp. NPDC007325]|uniref:hypothetical protein n=1 Tax=Streptomyces sp. NPDC007325 TaxID=3154588 RepID=UPI0033BFE20C